MSVFNLASAIIKWVQETVDKASNKAINETYAAYKTAWLDEKGKKKPSEKLKTLLKKWKCYWIYLYIWYCSWYGDDFDM